MFLKTSSLEKLQKLKTDLNFKKSNLFIMFRVRKDNVELSSDVLSGLDETIALIPNEFIY